MKIAIIGAGPAGLYFAISMKLRKPECEIEVFERNKPDDTFGWGVVFSDQTLGNLEANDPKSAAEITSAAHVPSPSSMMRKMIPRATSSSTNPVMTDEVKIGSVTISGLTPRMR